MNMLELLTKQLTNTSALNQVGTSAGIDSNQAQQLLQLGLPTLMQALSRNASTPEGAESLTRALEQHQDDRVDDITGFLRNVDTNDGAKILKHVFGSDNPKIQSDLASKTGLDTSQVMAVMTQLAPLVLGLLGKQKKEQSLDPKGVSSLTSMLAAALGKDGGVMGALTGLLASDKGNDTMGNIGKVLGGFLKR